MTTLTTSEFYSKSCTFAKINNLTQSNKYGH